MTGPIQRRLERLVCLEPGELARLGPFFILYTVVYAAVTLSDGIAITLYVSRVGADALPRCYTLTALLSMVAVAIYTRYAVRVAADRIFRIILFGCAVTYTIGWIALTLGTGYGPIVPAALFAARELGSVLILVHFGTYLQGGFRRDELNRVLPIVYAGGRFGGLIGGVLLEHLTPMIGVANIALVYVALMTFSAWSLRRLTGAVVRPVADRVEPSSESKESATRSETAGSSPHGSATHDPNPVTRLLAMPLFRWYAVSSLFFMIARWFLNYQYNSYFASHFATEVELATFLGRYTQWALGLSLIVQLFVVNRLVRGIGLCAAHALTVILLLSGFGLNLVTMTLATAIWSRMLESELRFGLRNPINQVLSNQFTKTDRIRVRAWTMGLLNPISALIGGGLLTGLQVIAGPTVIGTTGLTIAVLHAAASLAMYRFIDEPTRTPRVERPKSPDAESPSASRTTSTMTRASRHIREAATSNRAG